MTGCGETIACGCGCGGVLREMDERKRPRRFLPGHQYRVAFKALQTVAPSPAPEESESVNAPGR